MSTPSGDAAPRPTRVALALGSGGARGYAHIGVIEELEERGYEIVSVAGTSIGAVIGGLHAAGSLPAYAEWVRSLTQRDVLRLLDPALRGPGMIGGDKILAKVGELLGGARIEELAVPFTAVATDLLAHREVWFQHGRVDVAIRASMALPGFITPVMLDGRLLVDGGLLNPVPVAATAATPADVTVAVSLAEEHVKPTEITPTEVVPGVDVTDERGQPGPGEQWLHSAADVFDRELSRLASSWPPFGAEPAPDGSGASSAEVPRGGQGTDAAFGPLPSGLRTWDVMQLSLDLMQRVVARHRLAGYPPDVLVTVPKSAGRTLDFHRADELIALGRSRAAEALDGPRRA